VANQASGDENQIVATAVFMRKFEIRKFAMVV
jgi:hypothetical protein